MTKSLSSKITAVFKPWFVRRPRGQCQVLFALSELDGIVAQILEIVDEAVVDGVVDVFDVSVRIKQEEIGEKGDQFVPLEPDEVVSVVIKRETGVFGLLFHFPSDYEVEDLLPACIQELIGPGYQDGDEISFHIELPCGCTVDYPTGADIPRQDQQCPCGANWFVRYRQFAEE